MKKSRERRLHTRYINTRKIFAKNNFLGYTCFMSKAKEENLVFYFSGTGNCLAVAKTIAQSLENAKCAAITVEFLDNMPPVIECGRVIIVFPSYAYGLPKLVIKFLKTAKFDCDYLALLVTYGSSPGGTLHSAKRILRRRKQKTDYFARLLMVENYIPIFGSPKPKVMEKRLIKHKVHIEKVCEDLKQKKENKIFGLRPLSILIRHIFGIASPLIAKMMRIKKTCTMCGLCIQVCPAKAVAARAGKKRVKIKAYKCNHCQACLNFCPKHSINFLRLRPRTKRYIHPDIDVNEMIHR